MEPKVSVITPCYNGEKYVGRFLNSILKQTYHNIEFIIVNDGSTDNTEEAILDYKPLFENKGYVFIYIKQENKGQAAAINNALRYVTGEYLVWPDSDDILTPDSICRKVKFLEKNKEYSSVRSDALIFNESNLMRPLAYISNKKKNRFNSDIFLDLIMEETYCTPVYMVRFYALKDVLKDGVIYESRGGQNWQLLLPITYNKRVGYIDEPLYYYIVRPKSHSRENDGVLEKEISRKKVLKDILVNTITRMDVKQKEKYLKAIDRRYWLMEYYIYKKFKNKEGMGNIKQEMKDKEHKIRNIKNLYLWSIIKHKIGNQIKKIKSRWYIHKDIENVMKNNILLEGDKL